MPLDPPPRNRNGDVLPHDHPGIQPDDGVIRRVSPQHMVSDPKVQGRRISSIAFRPSSGPDGGMSVDLQRLIEEAGLEPRKYILSPPWIGAVRFTARGLRGEGLMVGYDPIPNINPYHGEVWGITKAIQKRLQAIAVWLVAVD